MKAVAMDTLDVPIWADFASRLRRTLSQMRESDFLIVSVKRSNPYVQFAAQGAHGLRVEATSNAFLHGAEKLEPRATRKLAALSWHAPTGRPDQATPEKDPAGSPNYFRHFGADADLNVVVELAVRTLHEVLDAPSPILLKYEALDEDGSEAAYDELGLKRTIRDPKVPLAKLAKSLLRTVREHTGLTDLDYDEDGVLRLDHGEVSFIIRLVNSPPMVEFCTPLVDGVRKNKAALELLNDLNRRCGATRFVLHQDSFAAVSDVPAIPFVAGHVTRRMDRFVQLVDGVGTFLESMAEHDEPPRRSKPSRRTH